jgi:hypothetical protein
MGLSEFTDLQAALIYTFGHVIGWGLAFFVALSILAAILIFFLDLLRYLSK